MAITYITPVDVSHATEDTFTDVDVTAYVSASATGVILHIDNTNYIHGFRKNGSTDFRYDKNSAGHHCWLAIGIDGDDIFEYRTESALFTVWLIGYFEDDAVFNTNAVDKSTDTIDAWVDVDINEDNGCGRRWSL